MVSGTLSIIWKESGKGVDTLFLFLFRTKYLNNVFDSFIYILLTNRITVTNLILPEGVVTTLRLSSCLKRISDINKTSFVKRKLLNPKRSLKNKGLS